MRVPLVDEMATEQEHRLARAVDGTLRWQDFKRALEFPDRPDLSDPQIGRSLARRLALEELTGPPPDLARGTGTAADASDALTSKRQKKISETRGVSAGGRHARSKEAAWLPSANMSGCT
jgi:hypothetical protein